MANTKKMNEVFASLGLRVRTGTACAITVIESGASPRLGTRRTLDLCDPAIPASRQPYHAVMQADGCDAQRIETELRAMVQKATQQAVSQAMDDARKDGLSIAGVGLVVGSQIDPSRIANEHIRAHAREGQLFRTALVDSFKRAMPIAGWISRVVVFPMSRLPPIWHPVPCSVRRHLEDGRGRCLELDEDLQELNEV
jgi:hypothetical protein